MNEHTLISLMISLTAPTRKNLNEYLRLYIHSQQPTAKITKTLIDAGATPKFSHLRTAVYWADFSVARVLLGGGLLVCEGCVSGMRVSFKGGYGGTLDPFSQLFMYCSGKEKCVVCTRNLSR